MNCDTWFAEWNNFLSESPRPPQPKPLVRSELQVQSQEQPPHSDIVAIKSGKINQQLEKQILIDEILKRQKNGR